MNKNADTQAESSEKTLDANVNRSRLKWSLPFLAAFLPIVLLSVYSFQISSNSVTSLVQEENVSAAGNLAQLLIQDIKQNVKLAHAISAIPGTTQAVETRDELAINTRLKALMVSNPQVHRAFIVDTEGILWGEFPKATDAYGTNYADRTWFRSVRDHRRPYISGMYIRPQFPDDPVVALAVPIQKKEEFLGVLVFEYRVKHLSKWLMNVRLGISGHMLLVDQHASLVAHPQVNVGRTLYKGYMNNEKIEQALEGSMHTSEYIDPETEIEMIATFLPISMGDHMWVVIAQQPKAEAFALLDEVKWNLSVVGGVLTLFTLFMVVSLARMSAKVAKLAAELGLKNQALKDFTSIVSHQLKAPITAMRWNLEMILAGDYGEISDELREIVQQLHEVNISNYHLVLDILNVSRLDRGVVNVDLAPLTLQEVADRAIRDYTDAAKHANLYLKVEGDAKDSKVMVDLEKCAESVTNAISNAIKYTEKGGITITLTERDGMGVIDVTDTGMGMNQEMVDKLFTREGVKKSNSGAESSSGLGLYIAKNFMEMQGGDVTVTSKEGEGTTFTYTLKLATEKDIAEYEKNKDKKNDDEDPVHAPPSK